LDALPENKYNTSQLQTSSYTICTQFHSFRRRLPTDQGAHYTPYHTLQLNDSIFSTIKGKCRGQKKNVEVISQLNEKKKGRYGWN